MRGWDVRLRGWDVRLRGWIAGQFIVSKEEGVVVGLQERLILLKRRGRF